MIESNRDKCLIPLYLGITGHRNIREEDKPVLKSIIKSILKEKKNQCPNTPVKLITPLADGADRLAARAAIECNIPFIAPLPMPLIEYRKDFKSHASREEFEELLNKAESWFELPIQTAATVKELHQNEGKRDDQYYEIGFYVARNSYMLIALWDGHDNKKKGGTAHIVKLKRTGLPQLHPQLHQRLNMLRTGSICHVVTPREGDSVPEDAFTMNMIYPDAAGRDERILKEADRRFLDHIDNYNKDVQSFDSRTIDKLNKQTDSMLKEDREVNEIFELRKIARYHAISDELANRYQSKRFFALKVLLVLTVIAFLFFQVYVEFWHKPSILLLYPLTMGIGALWFLHANRRKYEQKHEDYRALSEAYRVQYFLKVLKRNTLVADSYLQKYGGDLEWILYALRATLLKSPAKENEDRSTAEGKLLNRCQYVNDYWVSEQMEYYRHKSMRLHVLHEKYRRIGNVLFLSAFGAAFLLLIFSITEGKLTIIPHHYYELLHKILVVCTHSFLVISGAIFGYNEKRIFEEQSKTFQKMFHLFSHANGMLLKSIESGNHHEATEIIRELALESLMENADWLLLHRSRPMEIPKG